MNDSPAFQFYPGDYLTDENVVMMTTEQQGAYWRLVCYAWRSTDVGRLPNDRIKLAKMAMLTPDKWDEHSAAVLAAFDIEEKHGWITQKRLRKEYLKQQAFRESRSRAGALSSRKKNISGNTTQHVLSRVGHSGNKEHSPVQLLSLSCLVSSESVTPEDIYLAYPLQIARPTSLLAIRKAMIRCDPMVLLERTKQFASLRSTQNAKFTPRAHRWFDDDRFNDDPKTWADTQPNISRAEPDHAKGF